MKPSPRFKEALRKELRRLSRATEANERLRWRSRSVMNRTQFLAGVTPGKWRYKPDPAGATLETFVVKLWGSTPMSGYKAKYQMSDGRGGVISRHDSPDGAKQAAQRFFDANFATGSTTEQYQSQAEMQADWAQKAASKLRAEGVDPNDSEAVKATLLATVGGSRLYQFWLAERKAGRLKEAAGSEPMTPNERSDAYSGLRVTLNGKPAQIQGFRKRFATVVAQGGLRADWSWEAIEHVVKKGGKFKAEFH